MVIIWLPKAKLHLKDIYIFYKESRSVKAAQKIRSEIYSSVVPLRKFPKMASIETFSEKTIKEYHSLVVGKYFKVVYYIDEQKIYISAILDCRQDPKSNENKLK